MENHHFSHRQGFYVHIIGVWMVHFFVKKGSKWPPRWLKNGHSRLHMSCTCVQQSLRASMCTPALGIRHKMFVYCPFQVHIIGMWVVYIFFKSGKLMVLHQFCIFLGETGWFWKLGCCSTRVLWLIVPSSKGCVQKKYPNTIFYFGIFGGDGECNIHVQACFLHTTSAGGHY